MDVSTELLQIHSKVVELCDLCEIVTIPLDSSASHREIAQRIINDLNKSINYVTVTKEYTLLYAAWRTSTRSWKSLFRRRSQTSESTLDFVDL